jgi:hypothetical protein
MSMLIIFDVIQTPFGLALRSAKVNERTDRRNWFFDNLKRGATHELLARIQENCNSSD